MDRSMELYSRPVLNISDCVTVKLTDRNYILWKAQFEAFLSAQSLLGFVNGDTKPPLSTIPAPDIKGSTAEILNANHRAWFRSDQVIQSWLRGSLSEDMLSLVVGASTSQEVWLSLSKHFNSSYRVCELQSRFYTLCKNEKPMSEYLSEVKSLCDQLESTGNPVSEGIKILAALHGLGRDYEPIRVCIEFSVDRFPTPTYEDVIPRLMRYDERLQGYSATTQNQRSNQSASYYNNRCRGQTYRRFRGSRGRSFHQQNSSVPFETGNRTVCQICSKLGHLAVSCWHRFDKSFQPEELPNAMADMSIVDVTDHSGQEWYPNTVANAHVSNSHHHHLQQSQLYMNGSDMVTIGDANFLPM